MSTPLTNAINALTAYANDVTGASDTNLSDAVYTLAQGYGGGVASGTYTPTTNGTGATIDTGATGWTHFLIVPHVLPYETPYERCMGLRYADITAGYIICVFGSSSESAIPSTAKFHTSTYTPTVSGSVISFTGQSGNTGTFQGGTQYDWFAW